MEKFSLTLITLVICLIFNSWYLHLTVITFMTFLILYGARIPVRIYTRLMSIPMIFLIFSLMGVALTITNAVDPLMILGVNTGKWTVGFTKDGIIQALKLFFRAYGGVSCLYFLTLTTPMLDVIWVLKKIRVPAIITELMTIVYRFIFVLIDSASMIYTSQECRLGYSALKKSYYSLGKLIANLFVHSFQNAQQLYVALSARGYRGNLAVLDQEYRFSKRNWIGILFVEVIFIAIAFID